MALVQLNVASTISWKGGREVYNIPANVITSVPDDVAEYIKNSSYYSSKLVFIEIKDAKGKKKEETSDKKDLDKFINQIEEENKEDFKDSLVKDNDKEVEGLAQLMEQTLPSKELKSPKAKRNKK